MGHLYQRHHINDATAPEWHYAAGAPPFLHPVLGEAIQRRRMLADHINWDRIWFLARDGELVGYLQGYLDGRGPHRLRAVDLPRVFGWRGAAWRRPLLSAIDARFAGYEAYLYRLIIRPEYRGQGLGRALLTGWLDTLAHHGVSRVHLEVWGHNPAAIRFYEGMGFHRERERRLPLRIAGLPDQRWWRLSRAIPPAVP